MSKLIFTTALALVTLNTLTALTLRFDVSVASASGVANFSPFTFTQDVVIGVNPNPGPYFYPDAGNLTKSDFYAVLPISDSPVTSSVLSILGRHEVENVLYSETGSYAPSGFGAGQVRITRESAEFYQSGGLWYYDTYYSSVYYRNISVTSLEDVKPMTADRVYDLIGGQLVSAWSETASQSVYADSAGSVFVSGRSVSYSGNARLITAIPEPSALALVFGLFVTAFTLLRRKLSLTKHSSEFVCSSRKVLIPRCAGALSAPSIRIAQFER